jgi:hypothetical protein
MLCVSPTTAAEIDTLLELRTGDAFDFNDEDAQAGRGEAAPSYLFYGSHSTRCLDSSAWARKVKAAFERFSPRGTKTPPRLLRSAFVTALRSDPNAPESVKQAAAIAMKHSIDTQVKPPIAKLRTCDFDCEDCSPTLRTLIKTHPHCYPRVL